MAWTRGLCRALGGVVGRALRTQVSGDVEEASQRWRLIASAHRQRATVAIPEDVEHVDNLADEVHKQPQEPVTDDVLANAQGFPGRPHNTSVLIYYVYHVAAIVWVREVLITWII